MIWRVINPATLNICIERLRIDNGIDNRGVWKATVAHDIRRYTARQARQAS